MNSIDLISVSTDVSGTIKKIKKNLKESNYTDAFELVNELNILYDRFFDELADLQAVNDPIPEVTKRRIKQLQRNMDKIETLFAEIGVVHKVEDL